MDALDKILASLVEIDENAFKLTSMERLKTIQSLVDSAEVVFEIDKSLANNAKALYIRGKAIHGLQPARAKEAEKLLSRSVKLNPSELDAWNTLGECYFYSGNFNQAKRCDPA